MTAMAAAPETDHTVELTSTVRSGDRRQRARVRVPALTVLYHPDLRRVGDFRLLPELSRGGVIRLSRTKPGFAPPPGRPERERPLADPYLSRSPVLLAAAGGDAVRLVPEGSRTPVAVDGEEVTGERVLSSRRLAAGAVIELASRVVLLLHLHPARPPAADAVSGLVGESHGMVRVRREISRVADLELPVLLRGETGTGKELVARGLHDASRRRGSSFVSVNLAAVPASLAASELFGAVKGAYTGSVRAQPGFFQRADGGTLFLDEVGEAPAEVQAALLRVLESGEIQRVGSQAPTRVDVRLLAATDRNLEAAAGEGDFRAPLLHRLSAYEVVLPPLRERRDDFGRLLVHFLRRELAEVGQEGCLELHDPTDDPWLAPSIVARLARHPWPGNVRQLRNAVRQLAVSGRGAASARVTPGIDRLLREAEAVPDGPSPVPDRAVGPSVAAVSASSGPSPPHRVGDAAAPREEPPRRRAGEGDGEERSYRSPSEVSEEELVAAMRAHRWQIKPAAQALGVSRSSLYLLVDRCPAVRKVSDLSDREVEDCYRRCRGDLLAMVDRLQVSESGLRQRIARMDLAPSRGG